MRYKIITCKAVGLSSDACDHEFKVLSEGELKSELKKHYLLDGKHDARAISDEYIQAFESKDAKIIFDKTDWLEVE